MSHPTVELPHPHTDGTVDIDEDLAPLIGLLWSLDIDTGACCQDIGFGYASITFPRFDDLMAFEAAAVPVITDDDAERIELAEGDDQASAALPYPLRATSWLVYAPSADPRYLAHPWEWRYAINPSPDEDEDGVWDAVCTVEIPRSDLPAVVDRMAAHARAVGAR